MKQLPSTRPSLRVERQIRSAARTAGIVNTRNCSTFYEHGHWWVQNIHTGAQWDAVDTDNGFAFEQVTEGDAN